MQEDIKAKLDEGRRKVVECLALLDRANPMPKLFQSHPKATPN